jgi:alkylhydroperoxidase/carboxymuconolactone decarboxylase family protein YurZ
MRRAPLPGHLPEEAMSNVGSDSPVPSDLPQEAGPWNEALNLLREWDPLWAGAAAKMMTNPWTSGVLPRKFVELVCVALNSACTSLNPEATRRHIRAALAVGATRDEILMVLKMGTVLAIHSCSLGAPMLLEEAQAAGVQPRAKNVATPACDKMRAAGQWNQAWDPFVELDPVWTDEAMATGIAIYTSGVFTPKEVELLSIALDASLNSHVRAGDPPSHQGCPRSGRDAGGDHGNLELCVAQGVHSCNPGIPILTEELDRRQSNNGIG